MKRKVAQIGPSTLMVSLPNKWVRENNVKKGDELNVLLGNKEINFSLDEKKLENKEISLDISNMDYYTLARYLEMLYVTNYNKITLNHSKPQMIVHKWHRNKNTFISTKKAISILKSRHIGMEVVSQTQKCTEIRCFLLDKETNLNKIEKRIYFLFKDMVEELFIELKDYTEQSHENFYNYHDNIAKFITYYLRVLDQSNLSLEEKNQFFALYWIIDKMVDKIRHLNDFVLRYGCSKRLVNSLREILDLVESQFKALHKGKLSSELIEKRYKLVNKIENTDYSKEELKVVNEIKIFLDTINDFSRAIIVKEIGEKI
jgi:phosphate uptake regulator